MAKKSAFFIPFGVASPDGEKDNSTSSLLIGRDGERAFLINLLNTAGRRAAVLVTGRRGSGKTSFVDHCLSEYETSTFERFVSSGRGKTIWAHLTIVAFLALLPFTALLLTDLLEILVPSVHSNNMLGLLVVPVAVACLSPIIYGHSVLFYALQGMGRRRASVYAIILIAIGFASLPLIPIANSPALAMSFAFFMLGYLLLWHSFDGRRLLLAFIAYVLDPLAKWSTNNSRYKPNPHKMSFGLLQLFLLGVELGIGILLFTFATSLGREAIANIAFVPFLGELSNSTGELLPFKQFVEVQSYLNVFYLASAALVIFVITRVEMVWMQTNSRFGKRIVATVIVALVGATIILGLFSGLAGVQPINLIEYIPDCETSDCFVREQFSFNFLKVALLAISLLIFGWTLLAWRWWRTRELEWWAKIAGFAALFTLSLLLHSFIEVAVGRLIFADPNGHMAPIIFRDIWMAKSVGLLCLITFGICWFTWKTSGEVSNTNSAVQRKWSSGVLQWLKFDRALPRSEPKNTPLSALALRLDERPLESMFAVKVLILMLVAHQLLYPINPIVKFTQSASIDTYERQLAGLDIGGFLWSLVPYNSLPKDRGHRARVICSSEHRIGFPVRFCNQVRIAEADHTAPSDNPSIAQTSGLMLIAPFSDGRLFYFERQRNVEISRNLARRSDPSQSIITSGAQPPQDPFIFPTLFAAQLEEELWFFGALLALILLFFMEYEWVASDTSTRRKSRAVSPFEDKAGFSPGAMTGVPEITHSGKKKSDKPLLQPVLEEIEKLEDEHRWFALRYRAYMKATLVSHICLAFMPSLIVRVNLGFEKLNHASVTHSMLLGLRDAFKKKMMSWTSIYFLAAIFVGSLLVLAATQRIADQTFSLPPLNAAATETADQKTCTRLANWIVSGTKGSSMPKGRLPLSMCAAAPDIAEWALPILYYPVLDFPFGQPDVSNRLIFAILDSNVGPSPAWMMGRSDPKLLPKETLSFRVYHLLIMGLIIVALRLLSRFNPIFPYRRLYGRINEALQAMTSSRVTRRRSFWPFGQANKSTFPMDVESEARELEADPRSIELLLMGILEDISQAPLTNSPRMAQGFIAPKPEVTFVFDELDKITGLISPDSNPNPNLEQEQQVLEEERRRTYALHELLSDMKRVISSAPSRFIFVGNRLLHDEWISDSSRRESMLTSIFDAEIYLPSLLVDKGGVVLRSKRLRWDDRIWEFLGRSYDVSKDAFLRERELERQPFFGSHAFLLPNTRFPDHQLWPSRIRGGLRYQYEYGAAKEGGKSDKDDVWTAPIGAYDYENNHRGTMLQAVGTESVFEVFNNGLGRTDHNWQRHLLTTLVGYFVFRSAGNAKKLKQLLSELVRPASRVFWNDHVYPQFISDYLKEKYPETASPVLTRSDRRATLRDVIYLPQKRIHRIQLVNHFYRHLQERFESKFSGRDDDKVVVSLLYLFEFLLKFHKRAFSWSSLERIDELAHIHRSPDLRDMLTELVEQSSERYMHDVLNGMYSYRFRASVSAELNYVSGLSEIDQEAFNFTLDESQNLKATYQAMLKRSTATNADIIFGLGELYEYDQEYETARHHYKHCIRLQDEMFMYHAGRNSYSRSDGVRPAAASSDHQSGNPQRSSDNAPWQLVYSPMLSAIRTDPNSRDQISWYVPWGVRRLRLMMHLAMTEEQANNLQNAFMQYANCVEFANVLFLGYGQDGDEDRQIEVLKHMSILYQPMFANAWVAEKMEDGIDTSLTIAEKNIDKLRASSPFLKHEDRDLTKNRQSILKFISGQTSGNEDKEPPLAAHANFAVIGSEVHNKAGDLYFFKGRSLLSIGTVRALLMVQDVEIDGNKEHWPGAAYRVADTGSEGYLFRAHYHYCVGLHELRRFIVYRRISSLVRLHILNTHREEIAYDQNTAIYLKGPNGQSNAILPTIAKTAWPNFIYKTLYNTASDIADTQFSRVSLAQLMCELEGTAVDAANSSMLTQFMPKRRGKYTLPTSILSVERTFEKFWSEFSKWMESFDEEAVPSRSAPKPQNGFEEMQGVWRSAFPQPQRSPDHSRTLIVFGNPSMAIDRFLYGILLSMSGARFASRGGYPQLAAREYLQVAEIIQSYLMNLRSLVSIGATDPAQLARLTDDDANMMARLSQIALKTNPNGVDLRHFVKALFYLGLDCMNRYDRHSKENWDRKNDDYKIGSVIQESAVTTLCGIAMHTDAILDAVDEPTYEVDELNKEFGLYAILTAGLLKPALKRVYPAKVRSLLEDWLGESFLQAARMQGRQDTLNIAGLQNIVSYNLERHPFPVLNQLNGQKLLLDVDLLSAIKQQSELKGVSQIDERLRSLINLSNVYKSPLLFPVSDLAITSALASLYAKCQGRPSDFAQTNAKMYLRKWTEMTTMGREYYDAILNKFYLYDDFNDRQTHSNHARQMSTMDLNTIFGSLLGTAKSTKI